MKKYAEYMRNQVTELLTNYGKIDILVAPMLVAVASAVLFAYPFKVASTLSLLLGLCAVFVGLTDIFLVLMLGNRRRGHRAGNSVT